MHLRITVFLFLVGAFISSCKKENSSSTNNQPGDCVSQRSYKDGDIVEGQYIVVYKPSSLDARAISTQHISQVSEDVLQRNKISPAAVGKTFQGEPGGFIAHLSAKEAATLKNDPEIEAIEP